METQTGFVIVEKVRGKSTVTQSFSKYPLKLIVPNKVGSMNTDAVWIYSLTYGGGIVYKSVGFKCSEQNLEAKIGSNALLVLIPDPVTCFSTARYSQKQVFRMASDSSLIIVDWITSGRHESGEVWDFKHYKSTNHIFLGEQPLFLDSVLLEDGCISSIAERMHNYQVIAMVILVGDKLKQIQSQIQEGVKRMMHEQFYTPSTLGKRKTSGQTKPNIIASCSTFGPKGIGVVVRISAITTESVYKFLRLHLTSMESLLGAPPYH
ncbi:hypothetical protein AQUCO_03000307v1 [Aquilegia coerulea]|uniref:Urease accessory protein D n=1 Tax=Aquilegia coerulea TaxID=218851 RepID=A0A2G5D2B7_AQUCA|nr:hypothetical protein AQUCO_03000307v1 [Aquilegia coerulea]